MLTLSHRMLYALLTLFAMPPAAAMNTHRSEPPVAPVISQHVSEEDVHPTLDEIYKPPRLLGQRPTDFGMSADGQWITYRWADEDSEDAPGDLYLLSTRGSTTEVLATEDEDVDVLWTHTDAVLLRERDGWIDRIDIGGDGQPVPLFEGASLNKVQFLEDARHAIIQAGEDNQLWIVDLLTGSRRALASDLKKRSSWYQVLEDRGQIALFAQADAPPLQTEEPSEAKSPSRVLWTVPLGEASSSAQQTDMEKASNTQISPDGRWAVAYTRESTVDRELVMADYLTEQVTVVPVRSSLAGDDASALEMQLFDLESSEKHPLSLDAQDKFRLRRVEWSPDGSTLLIDRISNDFHVRQILVVQADTREIDVVLAERDEAWIGGPTTWANWNDAGTHILFTSGAQRLQSPLSRAVRRQRVDFADRRRLRSATSESLERPRPRPARHEFARRPGCSSSSPRGPGHRRTNRAHRRGWVCSRSWLVTSQRHRAPPYQPRWLHPCVHVGNARPSRRSLCFGLASRIQRDGCPAALRALD